MPSVCCPVRNTLLSALPPQDLADLWPHLDVVDLQQDELLRQSGSPPRYCPVVRVHSRCYFPIQAVVSCQHSFASGSCAEFAVIGYEGAMKW